VTTKREQRERTRAALIEAARRRFAEDGYAGASTEAILAETGVTRGALYHHFADKQDLFAAVCEALQAEVAERIAAAADAAGGPYEAIAAGCLAFIDAVARPQARRILLLDGPGVLGWARWNATDARHGFGLLKAGIEAAVEAGVFVGDPEVLALLLNGALNHAVMWAAQDEDPAALARLKSGLLEQLARLRADQRR
jgi:AcrR family transcriptional regulator